MKKYLTKSEKETRTLAKKIARQLRGGNIVLLIGELGAGKTTFVKGLAAAFGIKERIKSPTFVLMHEHRIKNEPNAPKTSLVRSRELRSKKLAGRKTGRSTFFASSFRIKCFVHADAYRVRNARELKDVGLLDWLGKPDTITVVEWGEKIKPLLKGRHCMMIQFRHGKRENERNITMHEGRNV